MRVLGIDPGLTRCGVGVVDVTANRVATLVAVTVVRTPPTMELDQRLLAIALGLDELISEHRPENIAIERVFAQHNVSTVMGTAQVSGIALLAAARHKIPVSLHTPTEVKASITGYGQAEKKQVGTMVAKILGLVEIPKPADAADALALAICHAWRSPATRSAVLPAGAASASGMTRAQQAWRAAEKAAGSPRRLTR
ncbi:crossover junction endodeoxyribonuclease RuvC [Agreia sp.]|uniref:crossover junction endodeoxyribonuclease RuvC n=1 Tax=Agreia sp. TaxID=1872416 RepID=UPI0035BC5501